MFKQFIGTAGAVLVLIIGLVSCSPENKKRDVYSPPPPVIRMASGVQSMREFDADSRRQADLRDTVDLTAAAPTRVIVSSTCRVGNSSSHSQTDLSRARDFEFAQVLPEGALLEELTTTPADCSFELNLYNEAGSNHIFHIDAIPIYEKAEPGVHLANEASTVPAPPMLHLTPLLEGVRFRFNNLGPALSQVACTDMVLPELSFNQVAELANVNLNAAKLRSGRSIEILQENPRQVCRVVISAQGIRMAVSPRFTLQLPRPDPVLSKVSQIAKCSDVEECQGPANLATGKALIFQTWRIENPSAYPRFLRFYKKGAAMDGVMGSVSYYLKNLNFPTVLSRIHAHLLFLRPRFEPEQRIQEDAQQITIRLEAREHLTFDAVLDGGRPLENRGVPRWFLYLDPVEQPEFSELSPKLEEIARHSVKVDSYYSDFPYDDDVIRHLTRNSDQNLNWP